jgi:hypothetical protein
LRRFIAADTASTTERFSDSVELSGPVSSTLIGRSAILARMHAIWDRAAAGQRQTVFVTGEPGIGKSSLIGHFLRRR